MCHLRWRHNESGVEQEMNFTLDVSTVWTKNQSCAVHTVLCSTLKIQNHKPNGFVLKIERKMSRKLKCSKHLNDSSVEKITPIERQVTSNTLFDSVESANHLSRKCLVLKFIDTNWYIIPNRLRISYEFRYNEIHSISIHSFSNLFYAHLKPIKRELTRAHTHNRATKATRLSRIKAQLRLFTCCVCVCAQNSFHLMFGSINQRRSIWKATANKCLRTEHAQREKSNRSNEKRRGGKKY